MMWYKQKFSKDYFQKTLTPEGTFWLFAGNNALSVLFVAFFLPETKGKSLEEIEALFKDKDIDN